MLKNYFKQLFRKYPKEGDRVRVGIGFNQSTIREGVVSRVIEDGENSYCWIDSYNDNGSYKGSFTASFCYAKFTYL